MAPYKSPLADPTVVNKISTDVKKLSNESVDIEERVAKAKREAADVFQKYGSDFGILGEVPPFFDQYAAVIIFSYISRSLAETICLRKLAAQTTRPAMWLKKSHLNMTVCDLCIYARYYLTSFFVRTDFVLIIEIVVEKITTKEKLKEAVEALKDTLKV